jgi:hypothetical protein
MDQTEIDQLIASADRRAVYINQVEHAKERFRSLNILVWEGHVFKLDQNFITYVCLSYMEWLTTDKDKRPPAIFLDKNEEPVQIEDLTEFVRRGQECHNDALRDYYDTYSSLQRAQSTEELIEVS